MKLTEFTSAQTVQSNPMNKTPEAVTDEGKVPRASDEWLTSHKISRSTFDKAATIGQNLQKFNPFGSEQHRKGFNIVRQACIRYFGQDKLGEYGSW